MTRSDPGTPRWRWLLALSAGVLVVHLWLLTGGLPGLLPGTADSMPAAGPLAIEPARTSTTAPPTNTPPVQRVVASTVRWILPTPPADQARLPDARPRPAQPHIPPQLEAGTTQVPGPAAPAAPAPSEPASASDAVAVAAAPPETPPPAAPSEAPVSVAAAPAANPEPAASTALPSAQPPAGVDLRYDVKGQSKGISYGADARLSWQPSGTRYTAELEISAFLLGSRVQTSSGQLNEHGLAPERFGDRRRSAEKAAHFDQAGQRIRFSNNAPEAPLQPGAQDRLSVFLQLAALMQARPEAYPTGQQIRLQVAGTSDAEVWTFQIGPEEVLTLPAGSVRARHLSRPPRREFDNTLDIWLAPALQHLPVRIRVTEPNGDVADQLLRQMPPLVQ